MKKYRLVGLILFFIILLFSLNYYFSIYYFPGSSLDGEDVSWQERRYENISPMDTSLTLTSSELREDFVLLEGGFSLHISTPEKEKFNLKPIHFTSEKKLVYDRSRLEKELGEVLSQLPENRSPRDASLVLTKEGPLLTPQLVGYDFPSQEELSSLVSQALENYEFQIDLDSYIHYPEVLTRELRAEYKFWEKLSFRNSDYSWTLEGPELYSLYKEDFSLDKNKAEQAFRDYFSEADRGQTIWKVDIEESLPDFIQALEEKTPSFEVSYSRVRRSPSNYMNTGIAVSLDEQWLWVFSGGQEIFQAPIVSGNPNRGYATHRGNWSILSKATNTRLANTNREGYSYDVPVNYWMQFNNEGMIEGFHDATWHWAFGTDVYLWDGSHGCVNLSVGDMATLYSLSWVGMPVWVY